MPAAPGTDSDDADSAEATATDSSSSESLLEPPANDEESDSADATTTRERVVHAIERIAPDAGAFYAHVQRWRRIPRAFAVLAWSDDGASGDLASLPPTDSAPAGATSKTHRAAVQGWLIAELSRTVFAHEALDMDLVEYVQGLVEHPEFCQPDLLVLELHEFLGDDVRVRPLSLLL